jgi:nitroreductase
MTFKIENFDEVITTTRAVRRRLDFERPVAKELIEECATLALQAPTGGNAQDWKFIFVDDLEIKKSLGIIYEDCFNTYVANPIAEYGSNAEVASGRLADWNSSTEKMLDDAKYLAKNIGRAPWILVACATRPNPQRGAQHGTAAALYGSIFPAVWSFNLALRSRGLGSVITTLHLNQEAKVASLLDIPLEVTQCCLMPIAYTIGTNFRPVARKSIKSVIYWNGWNKNVS